MKTLLSYLLFLVATPVLAQTEVSGIVTDAKGDPIPMANIILQDTYDGTSSGEDGTFSFSTDENGVKTLIVKFMGFKDYITTLNLTGQPVKLAVTLQETINQLEAVTISAGAFTASDESRRTVFRAIDIATTAGATADIAGALNTLPGTQKVGESGRLFVRGGDGSEARTFIDGLLVLDAYSPSAPNTPSRGRFLPFMFKGTSFSTGGYSAEYGQALSSALVLESKDESETTRTDIGLLSVGGDLTHTQAWNNGSAAAKIQYTNIRPYFGLIDQEIDWIKAPASIEGITAFRQKVGESGMFKIFGNVNTSDFSLYRHDIDNEDHKERLELRNKYAYWNASYKNILNEHWTIKGGLSYTHVANFLKVEGMKMNELENGVHAKMVFEGSLSDHVEVKVGAEVINRDYIYDLQSGNDPAFSELIAATFVETDVYASNSFVARMGVRTEHNALLDQTVADPRVSLAYKTGGSGQISLAYGKFRQSPVNTWLRANKLLASEKADHFILNYQRVEDNKTFRIEGYYKLYDDLVKFDLADPGRLRNNGNGFARGLELFWRDNGSIRNVDYWLSYSFLDTERNYLNFPVSATPAFASKHNLSAVYKHFVSAINSQLGFTYSYASGRPYYNPNALQFHRDRTPHYSDLSFNWSYLPKPYLIVYFSCTNLLGRDNIFGYEYSSQLNDNNTYDRRAIGQPARRFLFIGIFITLSKDKSVNQLPSL